MEVLILRACERKGWTLDQFYDLPPAEQDIWIAWEYQRGRRRHEQLERIIDTSRTDKGSLSAESITAKVLIALLEQD